MGLVRDEETITNDFLKEVQEAHPAEVVTIQLRRREEKFTGADWEWWLSDGQSWLGLLIQAKRLGTETHKYDKIKHRVGTEKVPQIELLMKWAREKNIDAFYFFYNFRNSRFASLQWNCCRAPGLDEAQFGCTLAHAVGVQRVLNRGGAGLPKMSAISSPLRCLVCCATFAPTAKSLPGRAYGVTRRLRAFADANIDGLTPRREPPSYVRRLIDTPVEKRGEIVGELRRQIGQVRALVIIKEKLSD